MSFGNVIDVVNSVVVVVIDVIHVSRVGCRGGRWQCSCGCCHWWCRSCRYLHHCQYVVDISMTVVEVVVAAVAVVIVSAVVVVV